MARKRSYKDSIDRLVRTLPVEVDPDMQVAGRLPTMASSEFLTNKEQGDWAESLVLAAINKNNERFRAAKYGMADSLAAGDEGFVEFYLNYQAELNAMGKRPDLLIYRADEIDTDVVAKDDTETISRAVAAIEVRSSSFLAQKYSDYMDSRSKKAVEDCGLIIKELLASEMRELLESKSQ